MSYHIFFIKNHMADPVNICQDANRFFKTAFYGGVCAVFLLAFACGQDKPADKLQDGGDHAAENPQEAEGVLHLTTGQMKAVGITLGKAERKNLRAVVRAGGSLEVPPRPSPRRPSDCLSFQSTTGAGSA